jgi:hypothetical protein
VAAIVSEELNSGTQLRNQSLIQAATEPVTINNGLMHETTNKKWRQSGKKAKKQTATCCST